MFSVKVQGRFSRLTRYLVFKTSDAATGCFIDIKRKDYMTTGLGAHFHFQESDMYKEPQGMVINEDNPIKTDLTKVYAHREKEEKYHD